MKTTTRRWLASHMLWWLPSTRFYKFKNLIWSWARVKVKNNVRITSSAKFIGPGPIEIGENSFVGHYSIIIAAGKGVYIGDNVDIGPKVLLTNGTHEVDSKGLHSAGKGYSKDIIIHDGVWLGAGSIVLSGVTVGKKTVIGAGSVVVRDMPSFCVAAGNPCRWKKSMES